MGLTGLQLVLVATCLCILTSTLPPQGRQAFSGADVNGQTLSYTANNIHVTYGGLDIPKADYVATNGTTVVLDDGAVVGTIVRIVAFQSFVVANTYTQSSS